MSAESLYQQLRETVQESLKDDVAQPDTPEQNEILRLARELELVRVELEARNEDLRRTSRELEASRDAFFKLYESAPVAFLTLSPKGVVTQANALARQLLAADQQHVIGQAFSSFVLPEDRGRYFRGLQNNCLKGATAFMALRLVDLKGRPLQAQLQTSPKFDLAGRLDQWQFAFFDISRQHRRDQRLKQVHQQLELAAEGAEMGIWNYDLARGTSRWNARLYRLLGLEPREGPEAGERFFELIHPEDRGGILESLQSLLECGEDHLNLEFRIRRADGGIRWLAARGRVYRDPEGRPLRISGVNFDITEHKQNEKALRLAQLQLAAQLAETERVNQELNQYAYVVSHDLKGPLRAIRNYVDFLNEDLAGTLSTEQQKYLEGMQSAVDQGDAMIRDLLDLSRIDQLRLVPEPVDLPGLVGEIRSVLNPSAEVEIAVAPQGPDFETDATLLQQILRNLMDNGLKFNSSHPKRIEIGWREKAPEAQIEIFVRDNGIGIDPSYHEHIFRIFERLHSEREYPGTGIGLAIVAKAAQRLGGAMRLTSQPGKGSTFYIVLPRHPKEN